MAVATAGAVCGFHPVYVDVVVCEDGATYRRDANCFFGEAHFGYYLCHEFMDNAVAASGAIVHVDLFKELRCCVDLVLRTDYIVGFHLFPVRLAVLTC